VTKANPPIKGHTLIGEGHVFPIWGEPWDSPRTHSGGCSCGAVPPEFPNVSTVKMRAWHRQHKEELRGNTVINNLDIERAVTDAATGNMETYEDYGHTTIRLDAYQFVKDLRSAGWDIVKVES
jgi:hypothetical protein